MKHPEYEEFGFEWVDEMYPQDENWEDDADLEMGFDPYEGCYTWDC